MKTVLLSMLRPELPGASNSHWMIYDGQNIHLVDGIIETNKRLSEYRAKGMTVQNISTQQAVMLVQRFMGK
jgi:hypothetical protein